MSTNKVYGDRPNTLPFVELETRWELETDHPYMKRGIDESMSIDDSMHSLFGVSKAAADLMAQEYGRYFGMKEYAKLYGVMLSLFTLANGVGPALSGLSFDRWHSYTPIFIVYEILLAIACAQFLRLPAYPYPAPAQHGKHMLQTTVCRPGTRLAAKRAIGAQTA